jgi:hypothetical protein
MEVNVAYTVRVYDCSVEVIIFRHGHIDQVFYNDWEGWPDTYELHACPRAADKSQVEKVW